MWKRLQNVYSQIKQTRLKPLTRPVWQPPLLHPVSYQPPTHRRLLVFPVCASSSVKTPLSSQVGNRYSLLPSMCFPASCPLCFSWEHHAVFQLQWRLALSRLQIQGNHLMTRSIISSPTNDPTNFYYRITGDSKERNTVLPPVRQLNVSDLLCTDLTEVYCWKVF